LDAVGVKFHDQRTRLKKASPAYYFSFILARSLTAVPSIS